MPRNVNALFGRDISKAKDKEVNVNKQCLPQEVGEHEQSHAVMMVFAVQRQRKDQVFPSDQFAFQEKPNVTLLTFRQTTLP